MPKRIVSYEIDASPNNPVRLWEDEGFIKIEQGGEEIHFGYQTAPKICVALNEIMAARPLA